MVSSYTTNKHLEKPANGDFVDTWNVPVNGDMDIIDKAFGGTLGIPLTNATVFLTQADCQNVRFLLTGVLSADVTIYLPAGVSGFFVVTNATSGNYSVLFATAASPPKTTVYANQGKSTFLFSDGTNMFYADDDRTSLSAGNGIQIVGSTISLVAPVTVANGGTGGTTAATARAGIGAAAAATTITAGSGLTGGGDLSTDRTISIANNGVTGAMLASNAVTTSLGYTPVNKAGDTMTGSLTAAGITISSTSPTVVLLDTNGSTRSLNADGGLVGFTTTGGGWAFNVDNSGNLVATGNVTAYSDVRLKKNLVQINGAVEKLKTLTGYTYDRVDTGQKEIGLIAQQVAAVFPEVVKQNEEYLSLAYDRIVAAIVEAIKELDKRIEAVEAK